MTTACKVIRALRGKSLVTAESCTGGGIGAALTAVAGASEVYKGGIISYCNELKQAILGVSSGILETWGAVSEPTAVAMAEGARKLLKADIAVSVTGLAGPGGDEFGHEVGTVFIGFADSRKSLAKEYRFSGDRESVRRQAVEEALLLILECI